jgi:hypothetical protein
MSANLLTPAQHAILAKAINAGDGKIEWFPDNVKGGARKKVLESLFNRALITPDGENWRVAAEGYDALGAPRPNCSPAPRTRENSKQAEILRMLQRPEGATIAQICAATGWQTHTVRGAFAGTFKRKLGLNLTSDKPPGSERIYRVI